MEEGQQTGIRIFQQTVSMVFLYSVRLLTYAFISLLCSFHLISSFTLFLYWKPPFVFIYFLSNKRSNFWNPKPRSLPATHGFCCSKVPFFSVFQKQSFYCFPILFSIFPLSGTIPLSFVLGFWLLHLSPFDQSFDLPFYSKSIPHSGKASNPLVFTQNR